MKTELTVSQSKKLIKLGIDESKGTEKAGVIFFTLDQCLELVPPFERSNFTIFRDKDSWIVGCLYPSYYWKVSFHAHELIDAIYKLLVSYYTNHNEE